ncbi:MAG: FadR/GntR family transcriptional regulator [Candidatus Limivicinus sp.]
MPVPENEKTLKNAFIEIIEGRILSGELRPGEKLKPERELAKELNISRGSVNQGILCLERLGFLKVSPRKGTFVADYLKEGSVNTLAAIMAYDSKLLDAGLFRDLMDYRILIERECVRLACKRINLKSRALIDEKMNSIYSADEKALPAAIYDYHHCLTEISGNAVYTIAFQSFEKMLRNLIEIHYSDRAEVKRDLPLYDALSDAIGCGDDREAVRIFDDIFKNASEYVAKALNEK